VVFFGAKFENRTLGSRYSAAAFFQSAARNPVLSEAKFHTIPAHGFGIVARAFSHASSRQRVPIGTGSPSAPKYPVSGFSLMMCFTSSASRIAKL
jgi:hypothetical protein